MKRPNHSDPLWDTRRKRLDFSLYATLALVLVAMVQGPETAAAIAPPAFIFAGAVIGFYFAVVEYGRVNTATKITEETVDPGPPASKTTTETVHPPGETV